MDNELKKDLLETSRFGRPTGKIIESYADLDSETGVNRPEGTAANQQMRDYTVRRMKQAGLTVSYDMFGNIFGRLEGRNPEAKSVMCGSHLDSVINGGNLDGPLGVFTAMESVRRMKSQGFANGRPVEVVAFTGEEGSAFEVSLLGSSALTGKISQSRALKAQDPKGRTLEQVLSGQGYFGGSTRNLRDVEYFLELHIEQGPILCNEKIPIGIVENIAGILWLLCTIKGVANHAGTTPMEMRHDALAAAAELVTFVRDRAHELSRSNGSAVATVGRMNILPNGINIVPSLVEMTIDIRDVATENILNFDEEIVRFIQRIEAKHNVRVDRNRISMHKPTPLSLKVIKTIASAAQQSGVKHRMINSGASHDAQNMAGVVKAGMIFVPSFDGISHSPLEWTDWEHIETGAKVFTQTVMELCKE